MSLPRAEHRPGFASSLLLALHRSIIALAAAIVLRHASIDFPANSVTLQFGRVSTDFN